MPNASIPTLTKPKEARQLRLPPERKQFIENLITACAFAICLYVFFGISVSKCLSRKVVLNENREAAKFPKVKANWSSISSFPRSFESFFDDRVAFRDRLVAARSQFYFKLFRVSGSPKVIIGKNDFLFYADEANRPMIMGSHAFSPEELHRWKELLERRHTWCNKRGIDYFFVLAPTKFSVYPEFLPWEYANYPRRTRTDELIDFLKQTRSPVQVIDLRSSLRTAKSTLPLYLRTDTHWNQLGAYYGYKSMIELLRERQPSISPPSSLANFNLKARRFGTGDLARMQGLLGVLTETTIELDHKEQSTVKLYRESNFSENVVGQEETRAFGYHQDRSDLPSMLMFRDSFAAFMIELPLPEHFSRSTYFWQPEFSESIVLREKPDIVIQEMLESCLYLPPQEM